MRPKAGAFSRYRPRILTLIVLIVVAAPTTLANLSPSDLVTQGYSMKDVEYGWPLIWYWRNLAIKAGDTRGTWHVIRYGWPRLAGNLAIWFVMLAAAGASCEWLVRRYRPRLRWSLRTMLAVVGIFAVFCMWCVGLRNRANVQDSLMAAIEVGGQGYPDGTVFGRVSLERWGPKWLDLVGADRFRRRIVGVLLRNRDDIEERLKRIGRLPDLRHLDLELHKWTPGMAATLGEMRQLRSLRIGKLVSSAYEVDECLSDEVLAAIGKLNQLKVFSLSGMKITNEKSLRHLATLTSLKSLRLEIPWNIEDRPELEHLASVGRPPTLAHLPVLPRLESVGFHGGSVRVSDLGQLATMPRLKAIDLTESFITDTALAELASLESLEELVIGNGKVSGASLESLAAIKGLRALHLHIGIEGDVERYSQALEALRQSNPGIVIDDDTRSFDERRIWHGELPQWVPDRFRWPDGSGIY